MEHLRSHIIDFGKAVDRRNLKEVVDSCNEIKNTCSRLLEKYKTDDEVAGYLKTIRYMAARTRGVAGGKGVVEAADSDFNFGYAGQTFNRFVEHLDLIASKLKIKMESIERRFEEIES